MYQIELVWNREFDWVQHGSPKEDLDEAIKHARSLEEMGDGERVKKTRIVDSDSGEVVWQYGQKVKKEKIYEGTRYPGICVVTVDGSPLDPALNIRNHSPTGFEWGYPGSGPAQLALAILVDVFGYNKDVENHYQEFKDKVVGSLPKDKWTLKEKEIRSRFEESLSSNGKIRTKS